MKTFAKIFVPIALILIVGILSFNLYGAKAIKDIVESQGSELLGVPLHMDDLDFSLLGQSLTIKGFTLENPSRYENRPALTFQEAHVKLDVWQLLDNRLHIKEFTVADPTIYLVFEDGKINLKEIRKNLFPPEEEAPPPSDILVQLDLLSITNTQLVFQSDLGLFDETLKTGDIEIRDLGQEGDGMHVNQVTLTVINDLIDHALKHAGGLLKEKEGWNKVLKELGANLDEAGENIKGLFEKGLKKLLKKSN